MNTFDDTTTFSQEIQLYTLYLALSKEIPYYIYSVQKNDYALYFTDTTLCGKDGSVILDSDISTVAADKLLDIAYRLSMNGDFDCFEDNGQYIYTVSLDESGMCDVALAIAPSAGTLDISYKQGSIQVIIRNDKIISIDLSCCGAIKVVLSNADVTFDAKMEFLDSPINIDIPQAVITTLEK